jgi:hypothetical protein
MTLNAYNILQYPMNKRNLCPSVCNRCEETWLFYDATALQPKLRRLPSVAFGPSFPNIRYNLPQ